jgi:deoxycytidine triphosphate deaminase
VSVKSDRWILKMCREGGMIKPFEARLVREIEGRRIISAGVSSYGYDLRLAQDGFRVFSPIASAEIDPKNFDENSLVEAPLRVAEDGSQYWLLPPHSYALGVTVETFNMPRNVVAYCLGKSTYARCFHSATRVALVDGSSPKIEEMAARSEKGELFWGYSIGEHGRIIVTLLESPRYIGRDSLLRVTLDNGEEILCTPDHRFLLRDGRIAPACKLQPGTSLMPLYRKLQRGYEMVYQPINGHFFPTHRLADEWNLRHGIYEDIPGAHRHHLDENRINNQPLKAREVVSERKVIRAFNGRSTKNHKVGSVKEEKGEHDVFCLTVPEAGNFALAAGVFVENCGLIVNATPLEPGWRGRLVLELSNSADLPIRIYANEGIAQVTFFESDEDCETSYADRAGKYQDQVGLVTPRL